MKDDLTKIIYKYLIVDISQVTRSPVPVEVALLQRLRGLEHVSTIVDYFEKTDSYVIVLEDCGSCVDLFDFISDNGHLEEKRAKLIFEQVLGTVLKIHEKGNFNI